MAANKSKAAVFFRIAAAIMLIALIFTVLSDLTFYIAREVTYQNVINQAEALIKNFRLQILWAFLYNVIPILTACVISIIMLITVIFLFGAKDKQAGVMLIINCVISLCSGIICRVIYITQLLPNMNSLPSYLRSNYLDMLENLGKFILVFLLGLLLIGVFKKASKVFGFILLGLFSITWVMATVDFVREALQLTRILINGARISTFEIIARSSNVVFYLCLCLLYISYIFCSLGGALKPRENRSRT